MAYRVAPTTIPGGSFRPWGSRLSGFGDYKRATFYVPTPTTAQQGGGGVTGGLGQIDLSSLTSNPLFWLGAAGAAWFFFFRKR